MDKTGHGADYRAGKIPRVALLPPNAAQALSTPDGGDAINSVTIWEPHLKNAAKAAHGIVSIDPSIYTVNVCLIINRAAYRSSKHSAIDAFAATVAKASVYITEDQDDAARHEVETQAGLPPDSLKDAWSKTDFHYIADQAALLSMLNTENQAVAEAGLQHGNSNPTELLK